MQPADEARASRARAVFDDWARRGRAEEMEQRHGPTARQAFERLALPPDGWYLDVGCGNGYTVRWAAEAAPSGKAIGLDVSERMIERARQLSEPVANIEFHLASFPNHSLPHGRFDAIFSMEALYYLPDLATALREIARLLGPGGRLACVVDYYSENRASHSWPRDMGVDMTLLDSAGWENAIAGSGLRVLEQVRLRVPVEEASAAWKVTEGSLLTLARKPG